MLQSHELHARNSCRRVHQPAGEYIDFVAGENEIEVHAVQKQPTVVQEVV